MMCRLHISQSY